MKLAFAVIALLLAVSYAHDENYAEAHSGEGGSIARVTVSASTRDEQQPAPEEPVSEGTTEEEPFVEGTTEEEPVGEETTQEEPFEEETTQEEPFEEETTEEEPFEEETTEEEPVGETTEEEPVGDETVPEEPVEGDEAPDRGAVPCFYWDEECTSSYGVDFPGNDIAIYRTNSTGDCCSQCKATEGCLHWVARRTPDGGYLCHLKSIYGFPTYCDECTFSYTKSEACKNFCETTCHNLDQFGPAVCGTDGYTYESPCQMQCTGVSLAANGECDSPFRPSEPHNY